MNSEYKINAIDILNDFFNRFATRNIEGTPHIFSPQKYYFVPTTKKDISLKIVEVWFKTFQENDSITAPLQLVEEATKYIWEQILKYTPIMRAEKQNLIAFGNVIIDSKNHIKIDGPPLNSVISYPITYRLSPKLADPIYKAGATPNMDNFLSLITDNDPALVNRIWQMLGCILVPDTNEKRIFLLQGSPQSGVSLLLKIIHSFFPQEKITHHNIDIIKKKEAPFHFKNICVNICNLNENMSISSSTAEQIVNLCSFKNLSYTHNGKFQRYSGLCRFIFTSPSSLFLNEKVPNFESNIVCIPLAQVNTSDNRAFENDLLGEIDNIGAKALTAYFAFTDNGYAFSGTYTPKIRYLQNSNEDLISSLDSFVKEQCIICATERCYTQTLYEAYLKYCEKKGRPCFPSSRSFSAELMNKYEKDEFGNTRLRRDKWRNEETNLNGIIGITLK